MSLCCTNTQVDHCQQTTSAVLLLGSTADSIRFRQGGDLDLEVPSTPMHPPPSPVALVLALALTPPARSRA